MRFRICEIKLVSFGEQEAVVISEFVGLMAKKISENGNDHPRSDRYKHLSSLREFPGHPIGHQRLLQFRPLRPDHGKHIIVAKSEFAGARLRIGPRYTRRDSRAAGTGR